MSPLPERLAQQLAEAAFRVKVLPSMYAVQETGENRVFEVLRPTADG